MASRKFAIIQTSMLRSAKMASVDHAARWAWLCGMMRTEFTGVSEYTLPLWSRDSDLDQPSLAEALASLRAAGLVEWDEETELLRLIGFHSAHPPDNASASQRLCEDFRDAIAEAEPSQIAMLLRASAEFAVSALNRSMRWKDESPDRPRLRESLSRFLKATALEFETDFLEALSIELDGANRAVQSEFESLLPALSMHRADTVSTHSRDHADTRRRDVDAYGDSDSNGDSYGAFANDSQEANPSLPEQQSDLQRRKAGPTEATKNSRLAGGYQPDF